MDLLIKNCVAVDSTLNKKFVTDILIDKGIIVKVKGNIGETADTVVDGRGKLVVFPGLFDMHVHLRDPGFTHKEDIITGCSAAAAGGFTGVACMPNTNPSIDNAQTVKYIINKAESTGVKVYPVGCITKGMMGNELCSYNILKASGAVAVSDDGRPVVSAALMLQALKQSAENNLAIISHCEDLDIIDNGIINKGEVSKALDVKGMDRASEDYITAREIALAASCNASIHIAHVSTKGAVQIIRDAKKNSVKVTCETCPHYFVYTEDKLLSRDADYRMNPPLRTEEDREAVLQGVLDKTIDCIVTDHAPHTEEEKADFLSAPNGVVGLETSLSACLTYLYHTCKLSLIDIARMMSEAPRRILNIDPVLIAEGSRADLTIVDTDLLWTVNKHELHSKSKNSVFKGEHFKGRVVYTISNGKIIYSLKGR